MKQISFDATFTYTSVSLYTKTIINRAKSKKLNVAAVLLTKPKA